MRLLKNVTVGLALAALAVSSATAAPSKGKPDHSARPCKGKAKVMVVLKGEYVAAAADGSSFQLKADHGNRFARPYLKAAQPLTIKVDAKTRYAKGGAEAKLSDLAAGDRAVVKSKLSRCDLHKASSPDVLPALTARQVVARTPEPADADTAGESSGS
jgi:hypothetical protein